MTWQETVSKSHDLEINPKELNSAWEYISDYRQTGKYFDPRLGQVKVWQHHTNSQDQLVSVEQSVNMESDAKRLLIKCKLRSGLNSEYIQNLVGFECITKKSLCSKNYLITLFFEHPETDLQAEEMRLRKEQQLFSAQDLITCQKDLLEGLNLLHLNELAHGNIRPLFIGFNVQERWFFLLDSFRVSQQFEKQQLENLQQNPQGIYMSPSLYKRLQTKDNGKVYDKWKNDLFALGMMLLELAIKTNLTQFYQESGEVDLNFLENCFIVLEKKYYENKELVNGIKDLLVLEDHDRKTAQEIIDQRQNTLIYNGHQTRMPQVKRVVISNNQTSNNWYPQYIQQNQIDQQKVLDNKENDYEVTYEIDSQGRKVEIRRYRPGKFPISYQKQYDQKEITTATQDEIVHPVMYQNEWQNEQLQSDTYHN